MWAVGGGSELTLHPLDKYFHLFLVLLLENGKLIRIDKNESVIIREISSVPNAETLQIPCYQTLGELWKNVIKKIPPDKLFVYDAISANCQMFVDDFLTANKLNNPTVKQWVNQDAVGLIESPKIRGLMKITTSMWKYIKMFLEEVNK